MRRYVCPQHVYFVKTGAKPVRLDSDKCSMCRWSNRRRPLLDLATLFEILARDIRDVRKDSSRDPRLFFLYLTCKDATIELLKHVHPTLQDDFVDEVNREFG